MELRLIDQKEPKLSLDLLLEWTSAAFRRNVGHPEPIGCPWAALACALGHTEGGKAPSFQGMTSMRNIERVLRRNLVFTYKNQSDEDVDRILQAKVKEAQLRGGPLQQLLGDKNEARKRWPWYLYCLSFPSCEELEEGAVRMPLDMVDLQVLALRLKLSITVSQFRQEPLRFQPPQGEAKRAIHLVYNKGFWAPLLGVARPEKEDQSLVGSVVELASDLAVPQGRLVDYCGTMGGPGGCVGTVVRADSRKDSYEVCLGWRRAVVMRDHILRVLFQPSKDWWADSQEQHPAFMREHQKSQQDAATENSPLGGIPINSLEWQILHDLVRYQARAKLEAMMQQLAGREMPAKEAERPVLSGTKGRVPEPPEAADGAPGAAAQPGMAGAVRAGGLCKGGENPQDAAAQLLSMWEELGAPHEAAPVQRRLPWDALARQISAGSQISACVVQSHPPKDAALEQGQLRLGIGDEVCIKRIGKDWVYVVRQHLSELTRGTVNEGWCPMECLRVWEATARWRVDGETRDATSFLALEVRDAVALTRRYEGDWADWGYGTRWGQKKGSGIFPLSVTEPQVLVTRWAWEL